MGTCAGSPTAHPPGGPPCATRADGRRKEDSTQMLHNEECSSMASIDGDHLPPIRLINFKKFRALGQLPRYPENKSICVNLEDIDRENSFIIFISHCWLRGWSGAPGWDGRPHPDNAYADKYKLCVAGIEQSIKTLAPGMLHTYVWIDYGCISQDGDPAGELKQLDAIVKCCDCIFTPIAETAAVPKGILNWYEDYKTPAWNGPQHGYVNRCWCRVEMFYAANIPVENDPSRLSRFRAGMQLHASRGVRPHLLFGIVEYKENKRPIVLPPLQNSHFDLLNPEAGNITIETDRQVINRLVEGLRPFMKSAQAGYSGAESGGVPHGRGVLTLSNGDVYTGEFNYGKRHGRGLYTYASGVSYDGEYREDQMHGRGVYTYADGDQYDGEYRDDHMHGSGVYTYANGSVFVGEFQEDLKHGRGVFTHANGDKYDGEYRQGQMHGSGVYTFADGAVYRGEYLDDRMHGRGVLTCSSGNVYDGEWRLDQMSGNGVFTYAEGDVYEGEFREDMRHGRGTFTFTNGTVYTGNFDSNMQTVGLLQFFDGEKVISGTATFSMSDSAEDAALQQRLGYLVYDVTVAVGAEGGDRGDGPIISGKMANGVWLL